MRKRIVILGGAESGAGAAVLASRLGYDVFVSDLGFIPDFFKNILRENRIEFEEGKHNEQKVLSAETIIKSPGIPDKADIMKKISEQKIPVISEIEFAYRNQNGKVIAITGTNGKSTTTSLIFHILQKAGLSVSLVGNIGNSFAMQVATAPAEFYVCEVSSFQLDNCFEFKPQVALLLNISGNHLDRYGYDMNRYIDSKFRIIQAQTEEDYLIYGADDENILHHLNNHPVKAQKIPFGIHRAGNDAAWTENNQIKINIHQTEFTMNINELALSGKHNLYNSMAAAVSAQIFKLRKDVIRESLSDFQALEHRLEFVANIHGIEFINDSKATNVNSAWYALESMTKPVVWIVGGIDKGNDYAVLEPIVKQKVRAIVCLGKDNLKIHDAFSKSVELIVNTMSADEAVRMAYQFANTGDAVLLSPACASFDLFENYEDRGRQYKKAVRSL